MATKMQAIHDFTKAILANEARDLSTLPLLNFGLGVLIGQFGSSLRSWYRGLRRRLQDSREASGRNLYDVIMKTPPFPVDGRITPNLPWQIDILIPCTKMPESFWDQGRPFRKNVCFVGQFNAGKTYLISLLANRMYPNSKNVHTDGIAGVYIEERNTLLLDSAGTDAVDCVNLGDPDADHRLDLAEKFSGDLMMRISSVFVYIISKFTRSEMMRVWGHLKHAEIRGMADMTVVYNLRDESDQDSAWIAFQRILEGFEKPAQQIMTKNDFRFQTKHGQVAIHHWVIVDNRSLWGQSLNAKQIPLIWQHLETLNAAQTQDQAPKDYVRSALSQALPEYVVPSGCNVDVDYVSDATVSLGTSHRKDASRKVSDRPAYTRIGYYTIRLPKNVALLRKVLQLDGNRGLQQADHGFRPRVQVMRTKAEPAWTKILIPAPNCVDITDEPNTEVPFSVGTIKIDKQFHIQQWQCMRVTITKRAHLDTVTHEPCHGFPSKEPTGEFQFTYPTPDVMTSTEGCLQYHHHCLKDGLLEITMTEFSRPFSPTNDGHESYLDTVESQVIESSGLNEPHNGECASGNNIQPSDSMSQIGSCHSSQGSQCAAAMVHLISAGNEVAAMYHPSDSMVQVGSFQDASSLIHVSSAANENP